YRNLTVSRARQPSAPARSGARAPRPIAYKTLRWKSESERILKPFRSYRAPPVTGVLDPKGRRTYEYGGCIWRRREWNASMNRQRFRDNNALEGSGIQNQHVVFARINRRDGD